VAELEQHLDQHYADLIADGVTEAKARETVLAGLDDQAVLRDLRILPREELSRESAANWLRTPSSVTASFRVESIVQDLRYTLRQLRKNLGFAFTAVLVLALGISASVALFAFMDAALIKPLPYPDPTRLLDVTESAGALIARANLSYLDYLDWKKLNKVFSSLDVHTGSGYILRTSTGNDLVMGARVSDGFFRTLGVAPVLGRDFYPGEDLPNAPNTVVLTYAAWQKRFGGKKDVIGQTVSLSGVPTTIIGVLPKEFQFAPRGDAEFWTTLHPTDSCTKRRSCHNLYGIARLKDGVTVQSALAEMTLIAKQLATQYPDSNRNQGASVLPLSEVIVGKIRPILVLLLSGAGLLLVIACTNVASLLLARSESRKREMAVRIALGASPARLIRQFVTEGLVLVVGASMVGLVAASAAMRLLISLIPPDMLSDMPYLQGLGLNLHALIFAAAIGLLAVALFSLAPVSRLRLMTMREDLADAARGSAGTAWRRLGSNLVVAELATAMVLLAGAGLLSKSLYRLLHVELAFEPDHLATLRVAGPDTLYGKDEQALALQRDVVNRVSKLPGVESVAITSQIPVSFNGNTRWIRIVGREYNGEHNEVNGREVSANYFTTLRARLLRGRFFTDAEDISKPRVIIINQTLANRYFPNEDPIGRKIGDNVLSEKSIKEIVGVVDDIKEGSLDSEIWPAIYEPSGQSPDDYFCLVVRTSQPEQSILPTMAAAIREIGPDISVFDPRTMTARINDSETTYLHRSSAWLVGGFAAVALLLGVVGLYGVIAYSVSQRTREIGVRMALGAERRSVYQLILKEAGWLTALGIAAGLICSIPAGTLVGKLLFGVRAWDLPTLVAVAALLAFSALLASYLPARRAASVNPVEALRAE
jgi:predicted permease